MAPPDRIAVRLLAAAALCAAALAWLAADQRRIDRYNAAVAAADWTAAADGGGGFAAFADAYRLAGRGELTSALGRYQQAAELPALNPAARYNSANAYLRQAMEVDLQHDSDLALPLVELAKQAYRELLAERPQCWDAKYNLERALQLFPDAEEQAIQDWQAAERGPRAVISIQTDRELP